VFGAFLTREKCKLLQLFSLTFVTTKATTFCPHQGAIWQRIQPFIIQQHAHIKGTILLGEISSTTVANWFVVILLSFSLFKRRRRLKNWRFFFYPMSNGLC
jgi:hypothetical protein